MWLQHRSSRELRITAPQVSRTPTGAWRVSADAGPQEVFFESTAHLAPSAEAFLTAFLLPAMSRGAGLRTPAAVCPKWLENVEKAKALAREWWGFTGGQIDAPKVKKLEMSTGRGMFFTGGVDSFFTLLKKQQSVDCLIYVEGYDVPLDDTKRLRRIKTRLSEIANDRRLRLVTVRTNLRNHPEFRRVSWEITFIAALAAVAHCLQSEFSQVYVASSDVPPPWGSHPSLDNAWSSSTLKVINHGADHGKLEKVMAIARWPLVHKYLRVCWENRAAELNCGVCEKCVRTELQFAAAGFHSKLRVFPDESLPERINLVSCITHKHCAQWWQDALERIDDPEIRQSVRALLVRSQRRNTENLSAKKRLPKIWRELRVRFK